MSESMRLARERKGLTQIELAREIGVDSVTVSRWERGSMIPSSMNLLKLAKALDVRPEDLIEGS